MSKIVTIKESNYTPSLLLRDALPMADSGKLKNAFVIGIDDDGDPRLWVSSVSSRDLAYLKAAFNIWVDRELSKGLNL